MTTFGGDVTRVICSVSWRRLVNETAFNILRHRGYGEHQRDGERESNMATRERDEVTEYAGGGLVRLRRMTVADQLTYLLTYLLTYSQYDCR